MRGGEPCELELLLQSQEPKVFAAEGNCPSLGLLSSADIDWKLSSRSLQVGCPVAASQRESTYPGQHPSAWVRSAHPVKMELGSVNTCQPSCKFPL